MGCSHSKIGPTQAALAEEAAAIVWSIDADSDGIISLDELREHMTNRGLSSTQTEALFAALDENADGKLSRAELEAGLRRARTGEPTFRGLTAAIAPPAGVDFTDLISAPNGRLRIADMAKRAITLEQLYRILRHVARRLGCELEVKKRVHAVWTQSSTNGERWIGSRKREGGFANVGVPFADINLYDCNKYVLGPATQSKKCSMVELMASKIQPPDYFVCHFWAEPILDFLNCLLEHSWARGLEEEGGFYEGRMMKPHPLYLGGRSPRYWVCAHANNEHDRASELSDDLDQSPFVRAIKQAKGIVSVIDSNGGCFERIWCVFELYKSLADTAGKMYTYDLVTATKWFGHGAVAITDGLSTQQSNTDDKLDQEEDFPLDLIDKGIKLTCADGQASVPKDRELILASIGDGSGAVDATLHGVLAHSALRRALEQGGEQSFRFLDALRLGRGRRLRLTLKGSAVDTVETWQRVMDALDGTTTVELCLQTGLEALPDIGSLTELTLVDISGCSNLTSVPVGFFSGLSALASIKMRGCVHLTSLPGGLFAGLAALASIDISHCEQLKLSAGMVESLNARGIDLQV